MGNKTCVITGASSGIGEQAAYALAQEGVNLLLVCRDHDKGIRVAERINLAAGSPRAQVIVGDLASLDQVRDVAQNILAHDCPLHVLLNNAGVFNFKRQLTVDGFEEMFAVNHLAHFLLTELLRNRLVETGNARVVTVGSGAHKLVKGINFDDLEFAQNFRPLHVYSHSKLANVLFGQTLARRLEGTCVTSNIVDPGEVSTHLGSQNGWLGAILKRVLSPILSSPEKGAQTSVFACSSARLNGVTGAYLRNCRIAGAGKMKDDVAAGEKLWDVSTRLTSPLISN